MKKEFEHSSYEYSNPTESFKSCTKQHFNAIKQHERYGVYIVRQRDTKEILYIGKSGTIDSNGAFKGQDIPKRLINVKEKENIDADVWFGNLAKQKGAIIIEYIFLSKSKCPSLVETALIQAYLNEFHKLPYNLRF